MICYIKDYKDGWLTMKIQIWDSHKLKYETPEEKIDAKVDCAEDIGKMKCFMKLYKKLRIEDSKEIIDLIPTYDMEK